VLDSYTVCGYCFETLTPGMSCSCSASQNGPQKTCRRYTESTDTQLNESQPSILGQWYNVWEDAEMVVPGDKLGATLLLGPDVKLCPNCKLELEAAFEQVAEIITRCMNDKHEER